MIERPTVHDYHTFFDTYVKLVPPGDLVQLLEQQMQERQSLFASVDEERSLYRYEAGKWSIRELVGHLCDTERVFSYRLLRAARGDKTSLPGFEQDLFVQNSGSDRRDLKDLLSEGVIIRQSTLALLRSLDESSWFRKGVVYGQETSALALACIIWGHEAHHNRILTERYLKE